jgi:hypothetical protein
MKKLIALGALVVLTGCGPTEPVKWCEVNPTTTSEFGQCIEADGEVCDSDPCDSDDAVDDKDKDKRRTPAITVPTKKPKPTRSSR